MANQFDMKVFSKLNFKKGHKKAPANPLNELVKRRCLKFMINQNFIIFSIQYIITPAKKSTRNSNNNHTIFSAGIRSRASGERLRPLRIKNNKLCKKMPQTYRFMRKCIEYHAVY